MRPITQALIASLVGATLLAGCAANDEGESTDDGLSTDITVTCPEDTASDANGTGDTTCPDANSTTQTPDNTTTNTTTNTSTNTTTNTTTGG